MNLGDVYPPKGHVQRLYCDGCKGYLDLAYVDFSEDVSGVLITIIGLPVLHCDFCRMDRALPSSAYTKRHQRSEHPPCGSSVASRT